MKTTPVIYTNLADVLFEDRNKAYGSYQMRQKDGQTTMFALGLTVLTAIALLLLFRYLQPAVQAIDDAGIITLTEVNLPPNNFKVPDQEPLKAAAPAAAAAKSKGMDTQEAIVPKPAPDPVATTTIAVDSTFTNKQPGTATTNTGSTGNGEDPNGCKDCPPTTGTATGTPNGTGTATTPSPYEVFLGEMPVPLNMGDIMKKVGYPASLREMGLEGKATYRILVDENGNYERHELLRASHPLFDKQCASQLSALKFTPGKMGKHAVKVWVTVPFRFELRK